MIGLWALAAAWGFAEAVVFFVVADVPISIIAVHRGVRPALVAAVLAAMAAAIGGLCLMFWVANNADGVAGIFAALPGIDAALISQTSEDFQARGYRAMAQGAFTGVPYKLYVLAGGAAPPRGTAFFMIASFFARLPRFILVAIGAGFISQLASRWCALRARLIILALFWACFYAWYWL